MLSSFFPFPSSYIFSAIGKLMRKTKIIRYVLFTTTSKCRFGTKPGNYFFNSHFKQNFNVNMLAQSISFILYRILVTAFSFLYVVIIPLPRHPRHLRRHHHHHSSLAILKIVEQVSTEITWHGGCPC